MSGSVCPILDHKFCSRGTRRAGNASWKHTHTNMSTGHKTRSDAWGHGTRKGDMEDNKWAVHGTKTKRWKGRTGETKNEKQPHSPWQSDSARHKDERVRGACMVTRCTRPRTAQLLSLAISSLPREKESRCIEKSPAATGAMPRSTSPKTTSPAERGMRCNPTPDVDETNLQDR
jgi:hypothetical protein